MGGAADSRMTGFLERQRLVLTTDFLLSLRDDEFRSDLSCKNADTAKEYKNVQKA